MVPSASCVMLVPSGLTAPAAPPAPGTASGMYWLTDCIGCWPLVCGVMFCRPGGGAGSLALKITAVVGCAMLRAHLEAGGCRPSAGQRNRGTAVRIRENGTHVGVAQHPHQRVAGLAGGRQRGRALALLRGIRDGDVIDRRRG